MTMRSGRLCMFGCNSGQAGYPVHLKYSTGLLSACGAGASVATRTPTPSGPPATSLVPALRYSYANIIWRGRLTG